MSTSTVSQSTAIPPVVKRPVPSHQTRSMSLTGSSPVSSTGIRQFRVPPPPVPFNPSSPSSTVNGTRSLRSNTPKLNTVSTSAFAATVDLGNIFPTSVDDPFDAEWTTVVTNNFTRSLSPSISPSTPKLDTEDRENSLNDSEVTHTIAFDADEASPITNTPSQTVSNIQREISSDETTTTAISSTNPFAIPISPVTSGHDSPGLRKEFQVEM